MESVLSQKYFLGFFILILLGNLLLYNPQMALWDEDEAAYAGFALNMIESGDWVNPDFFWSEKHWKPPFHFWTIAISYKIFGVNEFATRLPSVIFSLLTLLAIVFLGGRGFGRPKAMMAAMILGSTLLFPSLAKMAVTDMTLLFFETVAALSLFLFIKTPNWKIGALFWTAVSLGLLVKGPPILIMAGGTWFFLLLFKSTRTNAVRLHPWFFLPLALLPLFAWGYFSWQKDGGETVQFMIDWYILKRAGGSVLGQTGPPGYHLGVMILAFLPVIAFFPAALKDLWVHIRKKETEALFLGGWLLCGWIFYEIMPSKLPAYAVGAYPAIAILIAYQVEGLLSGKSPYLKWIKGSSIFFMVIMFVVVVAIILGAYQLFGRPGFMRAIMAGTVLWGVGLFAAISLFSENFRQGITASLTFGLAITFLSYWAIVPLLDSQRSINRTTSIIVNNVLEDQSNLALANDIPEDPSLAFYLSKHWDGSYFHEKDHQKIIDGIQGEDPYAALVGEKIFPLLPLQKDTILLNELKVDSIVGRASESLEPVKYYLLRKD
ncbi:MAG: glycosyltransferase family 39 protein [Bacteroidota bacterium]